MSFGYKKMTMIVAVVMLWAGHILASPTFNAFVDKTDIKAGETISLTLEYLDQAKNEPDLSVLEQDFTIISRQTSSESNFINGNFHAKTSWILEILPKSSKSRLTIPAIKLGSLSSSPIAIVQSEGASSKNADGLTLNVSLDQEQVYVNAELILHIEIKTALPLRNGTLTKPEIKDAIVEPLVEDSQSEEIENGVRYHIFKRSYAIFPSKVGTLVIPPIVFMGVSAAERGGSHAWPSFFNGGQRVSARSAELQVKVKDIPADYPKDQAFLPLKSFVVIESFDKPNPQFEVNKATARRFEMKAQGTLPSFLPKVEPPTVKNLQIYAENGNKNQKNLEDGIETSSQFSHVYMPTAPGKVTVPEHIIYWWDTDTDKLRTTVIRALELDVTGNAKAVTEPEPGKPETSLPPTEKEEGEKPIWPLFIMLLCLCIIVGLLLLKKYRQKNGEQEISLSQQLKKYIKEIKVSCDSGDDKSTYERLRMFYAWAQKNHIAALLDDAELALELTELERALFDPRSTVDVGVTLATIKKKIKKLQIPKPDESKLVPLYPN